MGGTGRGIRMEELILEIDISGQIQQLNYDSVIGCMRNDGLKRSSFLSSEIKKNIIKKYRGQVINIIEKLHCILIYYCIKDILENVKKIIICRDINFRIVKNLLPLLFKENNYLKDIKINQRDTLSEDSLGHKVAIKTFRKKKYADIVLKEEMVENVLFEFKK